MPINYTKIRDIIGFMALQLEIDCGKVLVIFKKQIAGNLTISFSDWKC